MAIAVQETSGALGQNRTLGSQRPSPGLHLEAEGTSLGPLRPSAPDPAPELFLEC